jgi:hypothetical protein
MTCMSTITVKVSGRNGDYLKVLPVPANHSEQAHFGVVDGIVVGLVVLCTTGLIALLILA